MGEGGEKPIKGRMEWTKTIALLNQTSRNVEKGRASQSAIADFTRHSNYCTVS